MVVNMSEIKKGIAAFLDLFDHKSLNDDTGFFADTPPTVEAFASVASGIVRFAVPGRASQPGFGCGKTSGRWERSKARPLRPQGRDS